MKNENFNPKPFDEDWKISNKTITKKARGIIASCLWGMTAILAIMTFVLLGIVESSKSQYIFIAYVLTIIPSLCAYFIVYGFHIKAIIKTPNVFFTILVHIVCIACAYMTLVNSRVKEPAIVVLILHLAFISTQIFHLPFVKPYIEKLLKKLEN